MGLLDPILRPVRSLFGWLSGADDDHGADERRRRKLEAMRAEQEPGDGHAPGHRHLGPPPAQAPPPKITTEPAHDQPWVRRSQSDSQQRRPRG